MKLLFSILGIIISLSSFGNMASPFESGTEGASPFISKYVDVLSESISITIEDHFNSAKFKINYEIKVHQNGVNIPMLFYAVDYKEGFRIWVDENEVSLLQVPTFYNSLDSTEFRDFNQIFDTSRFSAIPAVEMDRGNGRGIVVTIDELKYFQIDLSEGTHKIRVEYTAFPWVDRSNWIREYSFRYALSPIEYWKSLESLSISIDKKEFSGNISTNLGSVKNADQDIWSWVFIDVPVPLIEIKHQPDVSKMAQILMSVGPIGIACTFFLLAALIHIGLSLVHRSKHPDKRINWIIWIGAVIIPFLAILVYMFSFDVIDRAIGNEAGRYHGYTFLSFGLYPIILVAYGIILSVIDFFKKRHINRLYK